MPMQRIKPKIVSAITSTIPMVMFFLFTTNPAICSAKSLMLYDQVIRRDTTWSGEITIEGVVVVGRGATLTIAPGTTIRFRKIDRNKDMIGDSEIRVLGRLLAVGTPDKMITFSSAAKKPAPKDWSYVLIFTSGKENYVRYCRFKGAFSGLQVHFSVAVVTDNVFTNNLEGLRFGRGELTITNNLFTHNDVGLRFTRMEGPALISHNEITANRLGVLLVPSGQNITDFFEPDRSGRPWNTGRLKISTNNIYDNSEYNFTLGEKQFWDLDATDNWWGTDQDPAIRKKIFARNRDPKLGKIIYLPMARKAIQDTGPRKAGVRVKIVNQ